MFPRSSNRLQEQALLYVMGEMAAAEVSAFEDRLAEDQKAREALIAAVRYLDQWTLTRPVPLDPGYRKEVRRRLRSATINRPGRYSPRRSRWLWVLGGTAAAALVLAGLGVSPWSAPPSAVPQAAAPAPQHEAVEPEPAAVEVIYSELSNAERVARIRDEQAHRRHRHDDLRLPHPFSETGTPATGSGRKVAM